MFIPRIELSNFRSHALTAIDLKRITMIRAANSAGKTSLESALEMALTGRSEITSKDGKGSSKLIRAGQKRADIKVTLTGEGKTRIVHSALNGADKNRIITDPNDENWNGAAGFEDVMVRGKEVLSCLINNRYFVNNTEDAQKDILSSILLPKIYAWPEWVRPMTNSLELKINWTATPFEIIAEGYKLAYAARTVINRDLKNFVMPSGSIDGAEEYPAIAEKLKGRRLELEQELKTQASRNASQVQAAMSVTAATTRRDEAQKRIDREALAVTALDALVLSKAKLKETQDTAKWATRAAEFETQMASLEIEMRLNKDYQAKISALEEAPECPTCGTAISEEFLQSLMVPLVTAYNKLGSDLRNIQDERKALGNPAAAQSLLDDHLRALKDQAAAKGRIDDDQKTVKSAQAEIDKLTATVKPAEVDPSTEIITDLRARIAKGEEMERTTKAAADLVARMKTAQAQKDVLQKKSQDVEKIVKLFDADGLKSELLATAVEPFQASMNETLAYWGYECKLAIEPNYEFSITFTDGQDRHSLPLASLSRSQKFRFGAAFQVALAITSRYKFVVIDEFDVYDQKGRGGLLKALLESGLEQAIIFATSDIESHPDIPDVAWYMLQNEAGEGELPNTTVRSL